MCDNDFGFPFTPYSVQLDFMQGLIQVLEKGQVGIFESPTGTGKSMSLLCGSLTWLKEHQKNVRRNLEEKASFQPVQSKADDWLSEQLEWKTKQDEAAEAKRQLQRLDLQIQKRQNWRNKRRKRGREDDDEEELRELLRSLKENGQNSGNKNPEIVNDEDIILDYESGDEEHQHEDEDEKNMTRIYYCSRTHSQLSQFVQEVKRSSFGKDIRLVSLASRESLCINEAIHGLRNISLINERCLDLQKSSSKKMCSFKKETSIDAFSQEVLSEVQDVEELAKNGKISKACPYYTARFASRQAEIVVLPYNTLLHSGTRAASGLNLKDSVIIIDEAHNLMETIGSVHTVMLRGDQLGKANAQLSHYFSRYKGRLSPQNLLYVKQILFVLNALLKYLTIDISKDEKNEKSREIVLYPLDFLSQAGIDNINLFKLLHYCDKSHISHKLHGFSSQNVVKVTASKVVQSKLTSYLQNLGKENSKNNEENDDPQKEGSPFVVIQEFLRALTTASKDGRIICKKSSNITETSIKFLLLNPAAHFQSIVADARAIVLAGGTMHPHSEFIDKLLIPSGVSPERIHQFSCDHVVPKENLLALAISKGPSGKIDFDFTYGSRGNAELIEEAGRYILNLSVLVPGGMVVFFPSYEYEQFVYSCWERSGLLLRLSGRKRVFREPRKGSQVEVLLNNYAKCITSPKLPQTGAILLSIVGGKMSEGINFSDDLGRCVIMFGLPYPNTHSVEFKEKQAFLENQLGSDAANHYGHILCMRAVNQSIGRAIRHRSDYAAIILMDFRYQKPSVQSSLPGWICKSLKNCDNVGHALTNVKNFFAFHKVPKNTGP